MNLMGHQRWKLPYMSGNPPPNNFSCKLGGENPFQYIHISNISISGGLHMNNTNVMTKIWKRILKICLAVKDHFFSWIIKKWINLIFHGNYTIQRTSQCNIFPQYFNCHINYKIQVWEFHWSEQIFLQYRIISLKMRLQALKLLISNIYHPLPP